VETKQIQRILEDYPKYREDIKQCAEYIATSSNKIWHVFAYITSGEGPRVEYKLSSGGGSIPSGNKTILLESFSPLPHTIEYRATYRIVELNPRTPFAFPVYPEPLRDSVDCFNDINKWLTNCPGLFITKGAEFITISDIISFRHFCHEGILHIHRLEDIAGCDATIGKGFYRPVYPRLLPWGKLFFDLAPKETKKAL
jgi:hypothetical protein